MVTNLEKHQTAYKQTVENTKVPLYINLRVEEKDEEATRVLGLNIDTLSFWQKDNYRAEWPKFIFEKGRG